MASKHARLGPSSAKRWINCPGSQNLIEALPLHERSRSSSYADEGSAAHALGEKCLLEGSNPEDFVGGQIVEDPIAGWRVTTAEEIEKRKDNPRHFEITSEMAEHVAVYVDTVRQDWAELGPGTVLMVEQQVQPVPGLDDVWGTADAILYRPFAAIRVYDLKYGKGVVVEVDYNEQASCYGLGALNRVGGALDVDEVQLVIVQPRAPHEDGAVRRWNVDPVKLAQWGDTLAAAAARTREQDAPLQDGEWCRFCPAMARCPQVKQSSLELAKLQFAPVTEPVSPETLRLPVPTSNEELSRVLFYAPVIDAWLREVEAESQRKLERGEIVPGHKLVRKRANRQWKDEKAVVDALETLGLPEDEYLKPRELKSPAQIEKLKALGKPKFREEFVADRAIKPEGGLTIAAQTDPRPAVPPPILTQFAPIPGGATPELPASSADPAVELDWLA
jgi:hypothetical protein